MKGRRANTLYSWSLVLIATLALYSPLATTLTYASDDNADNAAIESSDSTSGVNDTALAYVPGHSLAFDLPCEWFSATTPFFSEGISAQGATPLNLKAQKNISIRAPPALKNDLG